MDVVQINGFKTILNDLENKGCNTDRLINKSDLRLFNLENLLGYVPANLVYDLYNDIYKKIGVSSFIDEFADNFQLLAIMQHGELMAYAPDVLSACQAAIKYEKLVFSMERISLHVEGTKSMITSRFIDNNIPGREHVIFTNLALMMNTFRLKFGNDWQPYELYIQHDKLPDLDKLLPKKFETNVYINQEFTGLTFNTSLLKEPMLVPDTDNISPLDIKPVETLSQKVECLFDTFNCEKLPCIEKLSDFADMSLRTFQRTLANEDTNFSQVLDNWRFKKALELLNNPTIKIKEISQMLFYSNVPNFEHAFKRWTNTHPLNYRAKL